MHGLRATGLRICESRARTQHRETLPAKHEELQDLTKYAKYFIIESNWHWAKPPAVFKYFTASEGAFALLALLNLFHDCRGKCRYKRTPSLQ